MASNLSKMELNSSQKTKRLFVVTQVLIRLAAFGASLAAALIMATTKERKTIYGFEMVAKYTYSSAFRFLVGANTAACAYSLVSLPFVLMFTAKGSGQRCFFCLFLLDLMVMGLLTAASSAATAIGFVGKYGNSHTGWGEICSYVGHYCDKTTYSVVCSYAALVLFFFITILSATKPKPSPVP
ncbi:CASP-like protein 1F1 [Aristolochia californica]|uniref:CASP-like protein 1F1 n=1 Tax=Aristolochia californica TaxID=171875 RepID=UPI0035D6810D